MKIDVEIGTARRINPETERPEEQPVTVLVIGEGQLQARIMLADEEADAVEETLRQAREQRSIARSGIEIATSMPDGGSGSPML